MWGLTELVLGGPGVDRGQLSVKVAWEGEAPAEPGVLGKRVPELVLGGPGWA